MLSYNLTIYMCFPSGPLPPQNLSLSHVTTNSALITWSRHPRSIPDGFVVNVTRGLNTRSRFLPNGKLGSYTLRELTPGQHYYVALTSVKNTGQEQIHSTPQHLAFTTCEWRIFQYPIHTAFFLSWQVTVGIFSLVLIVLMPWPAIQLIVTKNIVWLALFASTDQFWSTESIRFQNFWFQITEV